MRKLIIFSLFLGSFFNINVKGYAVEETSHYQIDKTNQPTNFSAMDNISEAKLGFLKRWQEFENNSKDFPIWNPKWKEEDLKKKFEQIMKDRWVEYFTNPESYGRKDFLGIWKKSYEKPANWKNWHSRYPYPLANSYNLAFSNYNASIVTVHDIHFLAMEAPCEKNLDVFYQVLNLYSVTDLVRLTATHHKNREACYPYWEKIQNIHSENGRPTLKIANREINYFATDCWVDHEGIEPEKLLALVKAVKASIKNDPKMIAVHCRAGVGRTGTFMAAYILMHDIDRQIAEGTDIDKLEISIDKVIWELSLQRPFAVTHFPQYLTLYQFVNYYLNTLR